MCLNTKLFLITEYFKSLFYEMLSLKNISFQKSQLPSTTATNSNRNGSPVSFHVLTAPAKEFKAVNNSISKMIRVMIDKQRILFSEVWDGVEHRTNTKSRGYKSTKMTYIRPNIYINKYP